MITTPPGLYLLSALFNYWTSAVFGHQFDNVTGLRTINVLLGMAVLLVSHAISKELNSSHRLQRSLMVSLLPTLYIFNFLYYTDVGSVFFTLLAYYGLLKQYRLLYLAAGLISLTFRQTNIIWVAGFFVGDVVYRKSKKLPLKLQNYGNILGFILDSAMSHKADLAIAGALIVSFVAFVLWNGGSIVLGDKQSHQVSAHWAQMVYFLAFLAVFLWPALIGRIQGKLSCNVVSGSLAAVMAFAATALGTVQHPYLLADNRHWTNVIWRHILNRKVNGTISVRHILAPVYGVAFVLLNASLPGDLLWKLGYLAACALSLIPSPLFEPRYYIIPTIIYILHMNLTLKQARRIIAWFWLINNVIIGVFLYCPFTWSSEPDQLQRYIW